MYRGNRAKPLEKEKVDIAHDSKDLQSYLL